MKSLENLKTVVTVGVQPPTINIRVRLEKAWDGVEPIAQVNALEHALRDAAWFLYGRRTSPGYTVTLHPTTTVGDPIPIWLATKVTVIPKNEKNRDRLARLLHKAAERARESLRKSGALLVGEVAAPELDGKVEVATTHS